MITPEQSYEWFVSQYEKQGYKSLNQFASANGFQKSSLSRYFHQQRELPADTLADLCLTLKTTPNKVLSALGKVWQ
jgi:hypothetical protein